MKDDIKPLYDVSLKLFKVIQLLFWINIALSIVSFFYTGRFADLLIFLQIMVSLLYIVLSTVDDCSLWYKAEQFRRNDCIQDAFSENIQELRTEKYYSNNISQSIARYGANIFESNFYSKKIAGKMLFGEVLKTIVAVIILLLSFRYVADGTVWLFISQTLFSAFFIFDTILLLIYFSKVSNLYDRAYIQFVSVGLKDEHQLIWVLSYALEYECIKSYFKVRLKTSIFEKNKEMLQKQWDEISSNIKVANVESV